MLYEVITICFEPPLLGLRVDWFCNESIFLQQENACNYLESSQIPEKTPPD